MKALDVQDRLEYALCGVAVLRALQITDRTITYQQFARAIGLMAEGDKWTARSKTVADDTLKLIAATERRAGKKSGISDLEYGRVINAKTGKAGDGLLKESRIVTR